MHLANNPAKSRTKMIKKFTASAIIGLAIAGFLFVLENSLSTETKIAQTPENKSPQNNLVSNKPFLETPSPENNRSSLSAAAKENFTESFIKGIAGNIQETNPRGSPNINGQNKINLPDPEELSQNLLIEAAQKFDPKSLRPVVKDSDLKISKEDDKTALNTYFQNLQKIVNAGADKIPLTFFSEELNLNDFIAVTGIYTDIINQIYSLPVPPALLTIHKKQIELLTVKRNILKSIVNYENDPLTTIFAAQELEKVDAEFSKLSQEFSEFIKNSSIQ
ncbi:MAG: hypothetical protein HZB99_04370 [Candidatus Harrisonbacteria bacterium]|nr:hypothetical protein [Candidatus Harrisonbacteria bacterium]